MACKLGQKPNEQMKALLRQAGSTNLETAKAALGQVAKALELPLQQGVLLGPIVDGIYEKKEFEPGAAIEFPLDFLTPSAVKEFIAYTVPNEGYIPEHSISGDFVMVPTYMLAAAIDWNLKYSRDARWDVVERAIQVIEAMFVRKMNNDGWHTVLASGNGRNLVVYDSAATSGLFTKRLVSLMKISMRRNAGGNSGSLKRGKLTDLFTSPESIEDMRSWDATQLDDITRREVYLAGDGSLNKVFSVVLHDLDELGVGQEYQLYYTGTLAGTMPTDKVELVVGLDLVNRDSFLMPVRLTDGQEIAMWEDMWLHRQNRAGVYARAEVGFVSLDSRRVLLGAL